LAFSFAPISFECNQPCPVCSAHSAGWKVSHSTSGASVPDVLAVPAESSALATPASASSGNASNASNATSTTRTSGNTSGITGTAKTASTNGTNGTKAASTKAVSTSTFGKVAAHIKSLSMQDCYESNCIHETVIKNYQGKLVLVLGKYAES
jgi:hypothetical protein